MVVHRGLLRGLLRGLPRGLAATFGGIVLLASCSAATGATATQSVGYRKGSLPPGVLSAAATTRPTVAVASPPETRAPASNRADPRLRRIGFRSLTKLHQHFDKHGAEFGTISEDEYLRRAQDLRDATLSKQVIETAQLDGTISRFDRTSGAFLAFDTDLTIRTFFRPNDGENYFWRAAGRRH